MVERRADVVGHAAVDGDVLADAGQGFQDAHGVERDAGVGDKATTRLDEDARLGDAVFGAEVPHGAGRAFREIVDRGGLVGREVGHTPVSYTHLCLANTPAIAASTPERSATAKRM